MKTTRLLVTLLATVAAASSLAAQDPRDLMPDVSSAKAKGILGDAIAGLGGQAYLNARDLDCSGTYAGFDSGSGEAAGVIQTRIMRQYPDKNRVELDSKTFI